MAIIIEPVPIPKDFKGNFAQVRPDEIHPGTDIPVSSGTPVKAIMNGVVETADIDFNHKCGGTIDINYGNGYWSRFCHMKKIDVKVGDQVTQGQVVGLSGGRLGDPGRGNSKGAHLHFTLKYQGNKVDPVKVIGKDASMMPVDAEKDSEKSSLDDVLDKINFDTGTGSDLLGAMTSSIAKGMLGMKEEIQRIKQLMK